MNDTDLPGTGEGTIDMSDAGTAKTRIMSTRRAPLADVEFLKLTAPLAPDAAWEVESFLLKIFERGDYSLRSALLGEYAETLNCTFILARYATKVVGAAGCLYRPGNPAIALLGPVGVAAEYRRSGIGTKLVKSVIDHAKGQGCSAIYLGVSAGSPARRFYERAGFDRYKGIVMRLLLRAEARFESEYFANRADTEIRRACWGDFPGTLGLVGFPCSMYTVDLARGIFSSKYVEPTRFLAVFPEMMEGFARYGGFANVLAAGKNGNVVGFAHMSVSPGKARRHTAELDFYVHDNYTDRAELLVRTTIADSRPLGATRVNCYCLRCDEIKRNIIEAFTGKHIATMPAGVQLGKRHEDVLIYQIRNHV
jgi:GNAT superfamily N-acetyltransferase